MRSAERRALLTILRPPEAEASAWIITAGAKAARALAAGTSGVAIAFARSEHELPLLVLPACAQAILIAVDREPFAIVAASRLAKAARRDGRLAEVISPATLLRVHDLRPLTTRKTNNAPSV